MAISPIGGPLAGGTLVNVSADNLNLADVGSLQCDFLQPSGARHLTQGEWLMPHTGIRGNDTDMVGGNGVIRCPTPDRTLLRPTNGSAEVGTSMLGISLRRDGQVYSTHDDVGGLPLPYVFYPALGDATGSQATARSPAAGPVAGGTLVNITLPRLSDAVPRAFLRDASCQFSDWYATQATPASLASGDSIVLCHSPTGAVGSAQLRLALNGKDFEPTAPPLSFDIYRPPILKRVVPAGAYPGTSITLVGTNLGRASLPGVEFSCRFGEEVSVLLSSMPKRAPLASTWETASLVQSSSSSSTHTRLCSGRAFHPRPLPTAPRVPFCASQVVPATGHAAPRVVDNSWEADTVACTVPPAAQPHAGGSVRLSVSLNGQQYTPEHVNFAIAPVDTRRTLENIFHEVPADLVGDVEDTGSGDALGERGSAEAGSAETGSGAEGSGELASGAPSQGSGEASSGSG